MLILLIILSVICGVHMYVTYRMNIMINELASTNYDEHKILSKNDKTIVKDLQSIFKKQLKISENINTLFTISKTIINFGNTMQNSDYSEECKKLNKEIYNLKSINAGLLETIAKLRKDIEHIDNEKGEET